MGSLEATSRRPLVDAEADPPRLEEFPHGREEPFWDFGSDAHHELSQATRGLGVRTRDLPGGGERLVELERMEETGKASSSEGPRRGVEANWPAGEVQGGVTVDVVDSSVESAVDQGPMTCGANDLRADVFPGL